MKNKNSPIKIKLMRTRKDENDLKNFNQNPNSINPFKGSGVII